METSVLPAVRHVEHHHEGRSRPDRAGRLQLDHHRPGQRPAQTKVVLFAGQPLGAPVVHGGPFVMNKQQPLGEQQKATCSPSGQHNPARRIGTSEDIAEAVVVALTNTFMTAISLGIDGGERLV